MSEPKTARELAEELINRIFASAEYDEGGYADLLNKIKEEQLEPVTAAIDAHVQAVTKSLKIDVELLEQNCSSYKEQAEYFEGMVAALCKREAEAREIIEYFYFKKHENTFDLPSRAINKWLADAKAESQNGGDDEG